MSIQLVIGRAGSGKTAYCLDSIRKRLEECPDGEPLILLVPEQSTFQAERELVATPGLAGIIRAQALSFRRLAWRIMQETGGTARVPINDSGKQMLIHKIFHENREQLRIFPASADQTGFLEQVCELFNEWKRYRVSGERLKRFFTEHAGLFARNSARLKDKIHDLMFVYERFEDELSRSYLDGEACLDHLAAQLKNSVYLRRAEIWVDGFYGFTPQEFAVLEQMCIHCRHVTVTLCLDREYHAGDRLHDLDLFHPTARTMIALQQLADKAGVEKKPVIRLGDGGLPRFRESPMLAALESLLSRQRTKPEEDGHLSPPAISVYEAASRRAEVEGVAREMIRLVRDCGMRWRDLVVWVRNMEAYGDLLESIFAEHGIPYFLDQKKSPAHHPLIEFIRSSLEVVGGRWRYEAVFRCVKTEFLFPLYSDDIAEDRIRHHRHVADLLENFVLAAGIQGSRWTEERPWDYRLRYNLEDEEERNGTADRATFEQLERCRRQVAEPLSRFEKRMGQARNVREMAEALYLLLSEVRVPDRLEQWSRNAMAKGRAEKAREHVQVWGSVIDLLDQMVELLGDETLPLNLFTALVESGLDSLRLGHVPPALDQVLIANIDRTRPAQMKCAFVIGVNEGVLPARISEEGILTEAEREVLLDSGLPMAEGSRRRLLDEQFVIYTVFCSPSRRLWISYPLADEEGKSLFPSGIVRRLRRYFPRLAVQTLAAEPAEGMEEAQQLNYIAHPMRALSYLTAQLRQWMAGGRMSPLWWDVYNWFAERPEWRGRLKRVAPSLFYANTESPLANPTSLHLYGQPVRMSVSRMERYAACPFSHFLAHGLQLKERRIYRLAAPDIGQLYHAVLSEIARGLQEEGTDWGQLTEEQLRGRASMIVDRLSPRLQSEILLSSERYRFIARKLKTVVGTAAAVLGEHARRSAFRPVGVELKFGEGQTLPSLSLPLDDGRTMLIHGRIDRVDRADGEFGTLLRIIDYKSSRTSMRLPELYYGLSLQLLIYLDVVLTHAPMWLGQGALPAGALYFHVHNPVIAGNNALPPEKARAEWNKRFKMRGLVLSDKEAVLLMDKGLEGAGGTSSVIPVAIKSDGQFYKSSSVATLKQWNNLRNYVRNMARQIGNGIAQGDVRIAPYRLARKVPCETCAYKAVCQFDPLIAGNEYRQFATLEKETVWRLIEREVGVPVMEETVHGTDRANDNHREGGGGHDR